MFLNIDRKDDRFLQYECMNISQVKNKINEITRTNSITEDWKEICYDCKKSKTTGEYSVDYIFFDDEYQEQDCIVYIEYDQNVRVYLVWIEY